MSPIGRPGRRVAPGRTLEHAGGEVVSPLSILSYVDETDLNGRKPTRSAGIAT
jgi:hypothetical protein